MGHLMKKYSKPTITVIRLFSPVIMQSCSNIDGGGDKGDYQEGTQASREYSNYDVWGLDEWDDNEWDEE